jgi:penicillin V acylase-like amidase (Ntn superfamily)
MTDNQGRKLNYHLKSNKNNLDKSNPHIITNSPTLDNKIKAKNQFNNLNNIMKIELKSAKVIFKN